MNILESDKKVHEMTPYRAGQLAELAGDLAKRMTTSRYGYLDWDEVEIVLNSLRNHFEAAHKKGEI